MDRKDWKREPAQKIRRMDEPRPANQSYCLRHEGMGFAVAVARCRVATDRKFSAADELLTNPDLKAVFKEAHEKGVALGPAPDPGFDE